jgi:diguanylate cyclase (GGDEF)-like protein
MPRLVALQKGGVEEITLGDRATLGRGRECDVYLPEPTVSRLHAEIQRLPDGRYGLRHAGRKCQTFVNGAPVTEVVLADGDVMAIGSARFRFEDPEAMPHLANNVEYANDDSAIHARLDASAEPVSMPQVGEELGAVLARERRLRTAFDFIRALGFESQVDTLLETMMAALMKLFNPDHAVLLLTHPETNQLVPKLVHPVSEGNRTRLSRWILREALAKHEALLSLDACCDTRFVDSESVVRQGIHSVMCVPMIGGDEVVGVIHVDSRTSSGLFDANDLELLTVFARHAALALRNANLRTSLARTNEQLRQASQTAEAANAELQKMNRQLEKLVVRDPQTGLYNQTYLHERLEEEIVRSVRHGQSLSLIMICIDNFDTLTNRLGFAVGNRTLQHLAGLIIDEGRAADVPGLLKEREVATRYGGDTIAVLLPETKKRNAAAKAENLRQRVVSLDWSRAGVAALGLSAGVAAFPDDAKDPMGLVRAAQAALEAARRSGANQVVAYAPVLAHAGDEQDDAANTDIKKITAIDRVLINRALKFVYQPIIDAARETIFAYEALCRPADATFAGPVELFDAAERTGRIRELGELVRELCVVPLPDLAEPGVLFVNVHPLELNEALVAWAESQKADARRIVLEITEAAEVLDYGRTRELLARLQGLGFRIAVDDLGSGYAGLNSLARLAPDFAKLDTAMLRGIEPNSRPARLIHHLIDYANGEGMLVVAEGIETVEECRVVRELGCHLLQGYLFARPSPPFCGIASTKPNKI